MRAWEKFLEQQEREIGAQLVRKWLRTLKITHFDARNLYLEALDTFQIDWFEEHIRPKVVDQLTWNSRKIRVHLALANPPKAEESTKRERNPPGEAPPSFRFDVLDPLATFSYYHQTEANGLTYKILQQVAGRYEEGESHSPEQIVEFNPIYIYGRSGTGKTHLAMALGHDLRAIGKRVIYVTGETFANHVVEAIRSGRMQEFRKAYRNTDLLVLDGVEELSGKAATQEELFHTFNALHLEGALIFACARCCPQDLKNVEPRLISRFEWGVVLPVEPLEDEDLIQAIQVRAGALGLDLKLAVIRYIARSFNHSNASCMHAVESLSMAVRLSGKHSEELTIDEVKDLLSREIEEVGKRRIGAEEVLEVVSDHLNIPLDAILGPKHTQDAVYGRHLAMYFCRSLLQMKYAPIGELFGRDHSTVVNAVKKVEAALEEVTSRHSGDVHHIEQRLLEQVS